MSKLVMAALSQYGQKEITGSQHNEFITRYFTDLGFDGNKFGDETNWCSAAISHLCKTMGMPYNKGLNARGWLDIGVAVETPQIGDIVILWRGAHKDELIEGSNLKKGHVCIFINQIGNQLFCLGGNQSNQFVISVQEPSKVLGYRRLEF